MVASRNQTEKREQTVLLTLVALYLQTAKPIGSNTLKEEKLQHMSSATIRNYFTKLEAQGFLHQQHASGGRVPTPLAYKFYADHYINSQDISPEELEILQKELEWDTRKIASYLHHASEVLSRLTGGAIFLSSPRFDQDFITQVKLVSIDVKRCLCILITDFGLVHTNILYTDQKLSHFSLNRIASYFHFRITGLDRPKLSKKEESIAIEFYNEILLRYIVNDSHFSAEDIYKTGFSRLLAYPEFRDAAILAKGLSVFENTTYMRSLLNQCVKKEKLHCWIGNDLDHPGVSTPYITVLAIPYAIHKKAVGAVAFLGPIRVPYPKLFGLLHTFSALLSQVLTRNLYKYQLTYRQPMTKQIGSKTASPPSFGQVDYLQLEDQS